MQFIKILGNSQRWGGRQPGIVISIWNNALEEFGFIMDDLCSCPNQTRNSWFFWSKGFFCECKCRSWMIFPLDTSKWNHQRYIYLLHASNWQQILVMCLATMWQRAWEFVVRVDIGNLNVNMILSFNSFLSSWSSWRQIRGEFVRELITLFDVWVFERRPNWRRRPRLSSQTRNATPRRPLTSLWPASSVPGPHPLPLEGPWHTPCLHCHPDSTTSTPSMLT